MENEPTKQQFLNAQRTHLQEAKELYKIEILLLGTQSFMFEIQRRVRNLKGAWIRDMFWSGRASWRSRKALKLTLSKC